ncbi:IS200/IS605 family transposase [Rubritalea sp.]|uniref:IS200/IS605 family transposase n=1 Tax=Rubritalea sp. TaxID=2109375 RepID=UPI003EF664C7
MSQSLSKVVIHLVFSTKERSPSINDQIKSRLHAYLASLARDHGWECYRVGGVADHVHLALLQPRTCELAELVGHIKRQSTLWLKREGIEVFQWQRGYGAFSVSPCSLSDLLDYIDRQEEHHMKLSFQEEYLKILKKYQMEYDETYLWD